MLISSVSWVPRQAGGFASLKCFHSVRQHSASIRFYLPGRLPPVSVVESGQVLSSSCHSAWRHQSPLPLATLPNVACDPIFSKSSVSGLSFSELLSPAPELQICLQPNHGRGGDLASTGCPTSYSCKAVCIKTTKTQFLWEEVFPSATSQNS